MNQPDRSAPPAAYSIHAYPCLPDHRAIYMLLAGIVLGIVLGPALLGRVMPEVYQRIFVGADAARKELLSFEDQAKAQKLEQEAQFVKQINDLQQSGVSEAALDELKAKQDLQRQELEQKQELTRQVIIASRIEPALLDHARQIQGVMNSLFAALIIATILQSVLNTAPSTPSSSESQAGVDSPTPSTAGLLLARYRLGLAYGQVAIAALWIALLLAQPALLIQMSILVMAAVLLIVLLAALIPWSRQG